MMMEPIQLPESAVFLKDGHAVTTSLKVAEIFGKLHKNVRQSIERLDCSEGFSRLNFQPAEYLDEQKKPRPMFEVTRDGFTFLAMGFSGAEAARFKEAYINRFNEMEAVLRGGLSQALMQAEKSWFSRRPNWPKIRDRALTGDTNRDIAIAVGVSRDSVARSLRRMIEFGLIDPSRLAVLRSGPSKRAALRHVEAWGKRGDTRQMSFGFEVPNE